jgi:hypothetical protein
LRAAHRTLVIIIHSLILCFFQETLIAQVPLRDVANAMQPGTWAAVPQTNINSVLAQGPTTGHQLPFAMSASWDPTLLKLHFVGTDHGTNVTSYMGYDAQANSWTFFGDTPMTPSHGYDHTSIDPRTGTLYTREYGSNDIFKRPVGGSWTLASSWPVGAYIQVAIGTDWWSGPLTGGSANGNLVAYNCGAANGELFLWNASTNSWFATITGFGGQNTYHCFLEYSPGHNVAIFGGGNANGRKVWRLNADRSVTAMPDAPMDLGIQRANVTVDPVSGNFLVMGYGQLWEYDPRGTGRWTQQTGSRTPPSAVGNPGSPNLDGIISTPISNYGVVNYVTCRIEGCVMYLYKHATGTSTPPPADTVTPSVSITAPGNGSSVSGSVTITGTAADNVSVAGVQFKLDGADLGAEDTSSPYSVSWNTTAATPGSHTLTAVARDSSGNQATSATVSVSVTAPAADTTLPSVSITAPVSGSTVSGSITVTATAADNVGVAAVQFQLDGANLGAQDTSAPYSVSWDTATAANASHVLTAVARDSAGNQQSASVSITVNNGGGSTSSDFATRCAAPGVVRCVSFDQAADIAGTYGDNHGTLPGIAVPQLDSVNKASGNSSLRFTIPSNSGSSGSGSYFVNFSDDLSVQFGENSEFYVQWRQRFSPEFLNTKFEGGGGWKQSIIGTGDKQGCSSSTSTGGQCYSSCSSLETVTQNTYQRGFPQMYNSCSGSTSHGPYSPFEAPFGSYDYKLQNARPAPYCLYSQGSSSYFPATGNCFGYFPNEWMTFQVRIKTGPRVNDEFTNSFIELWIAREGQAAEPVFNWGPYNLSAGSSAENQRFGKVWLLPYNTGKSASQSHPTAYTWYDDLIISRNRIADPGGVAAAPGDTTAPTISSVASSNVTGTTATITWTTNETSDSQVEYGTTTSYGNQTTLNASLVSSHSQNLSGLSPGTTYNYRVKSSDAAGNLATSANSTFTTTASLDTTAPVISGIASSNISSTGATIVWATNEASDSQIEYGTTTSYGSQTILNTSPVNSHSQNLAGLSPGTTYNYRVKSRDAAGNLATSTNSIFTTAAVLDTTPPVISGIVSTNTTAASTTILWTTDEAADSQIEYGTTTSYGSQTAAASAPAGANSQILSGLTASTIYNFRVKSRDAAGNLATSQNFSFTTTASGTSGGGTPGGGGGTPTPGSTAPTVYYAIPVNGAQSWRTTADTSSVYVGSAQIVPNAFASPAGFAIFGYRGNDGMLVSEASVPVSPAAVEGRIFVNIEGAVNTGVAMANPSDESATVGFAFYDNAGHMIGNSNSLLLLPHQQISAFLNEAPFNARAPMEGTFSYISSRPISVVALRGYTNERNDFLITTLPVWTAAEAMDSSPALFPHFADGGGWKTELVLTNLSPNVIQGAIQYMGPGTSTAEASPVAVSVSGATSSSFSYSIPPLGVVRMRTDGNTDATRVGSVRVTPVNSPAPAGLVIFSLRKSGTTISEASVPSAPGGTAFRLYAEAVRTGVAITNASAVPATVTFEAIHADGLTTGVTRSVNLPPGGQIAQFMNELLPSLSSSFQGIVRVTSTSAVNMIGLRGTYNERGDFLITTTPPANETTPVQPGSELMFPHIVSGGGYTTEVTLFNGTDKTQNRGSIYVRGRDGLPQYNAMMLQTQ